MVKLATGLALVLLGGLAAAGKPPETPQATFDSVYGQDAKRVAVSLDPKAGASFAKRLVEDAGKAPDSPEFQALLCRKAHEYAIKDKSGYATALAALELLAKADPKAGAEVEDKTQALHDLMLKFGSAEEKAKAAEGGIERLVIAGDADAVAENWAKAAETYRKADQLAAPAKSPRLEEIQAKLAALQETERVRRDIAAVAAQLERDLKNKALARQLLMLYLVDADNSAKAVTLMSSAEVDEKMARCLPLAVKPVGELPEDTLVDVGLWYRSLAGNAQRGAKVKMLARAESYCGRFLEVHVAQDAQRLKAEAALEEIARDLEKLRAATAIFRGSDLVADFTTAKNPNGLWSYGWALEGKLGDLVPFDRLSKARDDSPCWGVFGDKAILWKNTSGVKAAGVAAGEVAMFAGHGSEMAVARWTAPVGMKVRITGAFGQGNTGAVDVYVLKMDAGGHTVLFQKLKAERDEPFEVQAFVRTGDKIDFVVAPASGSWWASETPVSAKIVQVRP